MNLKTKLKKKVLENQRFLKFAIVGGGVTFFGAALLYILVSLGVSPNIANFIQALCAIELNFFVNALWTWADRTQDSLFSKWKRFHVTKVVTIILNQVLFSALFSLGIQYLLVYFMNVVIIMVVNYVLNEKFVFKFQSSLKED
jgi:putative flippase GtrA